MLVAAPSVAKIAVENGTDPTELCSDSDTLQQCTNVATKVNIPELDVAALERTIDEIERRKREESSNHIQLGKSQVAFSHDGDEVLVGTCEGFSLDYKQQIAETFMDDKVIQFNTGMRVRVDLESITPVFMPNHEEILCHSVGLKIKSTSLGIEAGEEFEVILDKVAVSNMNYNALNNCFDVRGEVMINEEGEYGKIELINNEHDKVNLSSETDETGIW